MILVNGDSITYGQGISDRTKAWPSLIFKEFKNFAEPGSSNFSIYRRTFEELLRNDYTHIVIGWSGLYRLEMADNYSKPKTVHPLSVKTILEKEIALNYLGQQWYFKNFLLILYQLMLAADRKKIKLMCFNFGQDVAELFTKVKQYKKFKKMFELHLYSDREIRHEYIVINKLIKNTENLWIIPPEIDLKQIYLKSNEKVSANDYHPNENGHQLIAQEINKHIKL